jgi:hypothetical protein
VQCQGRGTRDRPPGGDPRGDGAPVVVRGRESRPHGEGGQADPTAGRWRCARCGTPTPHRTSTGPQEGAAWAAGEPDDGKPSRPVRRGADGKGAARPPRRPPTLLLGDAAGSRTDSLPGGAPRHEFAVLRERMKEQSAFSELPIRPVLIQPDRRGLNPSLRAVWDDCFARFGFSWLAVRSVVALVFCPQLEQCLPATNAPVLGRLAVPEGFAAALRDVNCLADASCKR